MGKSLVLKLFVLSTTLLFIFSFIKAADFNTPILNLPSAFNVIEINIEAEPKTENDILFKINNDYIKPKNYNNLIRNDFSGNIKTFEILFKNNSDKKIKNIVIFNDVKLHYFKDLSKFEKKEAIYHGEIYSEYKVPNSVKWNKTSDSYNFRSYLNIFSVLFLSVLSNIELAFAPFMALFLTIIYYIHLKGALPKIKHPYILGLTIFTVGILLRLNTLYDNIVPWGDECFSIQISDPKLPFEAIFWDPGNPPLFFLLLRLWFTLFNISLISAKTLPFIFGILSLFTIWYSLKKLISLKAANIGLFLSAVNLPLIYYSGEIRGYIIEVCLAPILVYILFQIFYTNKKRYYIAYLILAAIISNIHYYAILFLGANFVFALCYFIYKKRVGDLLAFLFVNILALLPFVHYFISTAYNRGLVDSNFNTWMPDFSFSLTKECVLFSFQGAISLILAIVFFIKNIFKKEASPLIIYLFTTVISIFIFAIIISIFVRQIMYYTYFIIVFPIFIMYLSAIFQDTYKNKYAPILFLFWILCIQLVIYPVQNRRRGFFEFPISFASQYIEQINPTQKIYVATNFAHNKVGYESTYPDNINYLFKMNVKDLTLPYNVDFFKYKDGILFTSLYQIEDKKFQKKCFYSKVANSKVCYLGKHLPY